MTKICKNCTMQFFVAFKPPFWTAYTFDTENYEIYLGNMYAANYSIDLKDIDRNFRDYKAEINFLRCHHVKSH